MTWRRPRTGESDVLESLRWRLAAPRYRRRHRGGAGHQHHVQHAHGGLDVRRAGLVDDDRAGQPAAARAAAGARPVGAAAHDGGHQLAGAGRAGGVVEGERVQAGVALLDARGPEGWHGTRLRWSLRKMDELKAIAKEYKEKLKNLKT